MGFVYVFCSGIYVSIVYCFLQHTIIHKAVGFILSFQFGSIHFTFEGEQIKRIGSIHFTFEGGTDEKKKTFSC